MLTRALGFALGFFTAASASAQVLKLPERTTGLTPVKGSIVNVQSVRVPVADAITSSETRIKLQFKLQGCLDSLVPLISHHQIQGNQANIYVTALNAHNEASAVASCMTMPHASGQVTVPGIFQREQIRVVFMRQPASTAQKTYTDKRFGFRFNYTTQLALDTTRKSSQHVGETLHRLSLWPEAVYKDIQAGKYVGGTEYPPSIDISVHSNPQKLSLANWAKGYQPGIQNLQSVKVHGQAGITYTAEGLYPSDNVALYSPDAQIIHLSVSYLTPNDRLRDAFEDIVASFQFI
jgi:hypothetical protein